MVMGGWISNDAPNQNSHYMMGEGISVVWEVRIENGERGGGEKMYLAKYTRAKKIKYDDNNLLRVGLLLFLGQLEMIRRTRHMVIHTAS